MNIDDDQADYKLTPEQEEELLEADQEIERMAPLCDRSARDVELSDALDFLRKLD